MTTSSTILSVRAAPTILSVLAAPAAARGSDTRGWRAVCCRDGGPADDPALSVAASGKGRGDAGQ